MMKPPKDIEKYQEHYDEKKFGAKLPKVARKAGSKLVYAVLLLYYVLRSKAVSNADKAKIYGVRATRGVAVFTNSWSRTKPCVT